MDFLIYTYFNLSSSIQNGQISSSEGKIMGMMELSSSVVMLCELCLVFWVRLLFS